MPLDREGLVAWVIALADTSRVSPRPWRLEEALARSCAEGDRASVVTRDWLKSAPSGSCAPGLDRMLARLARDGGLVYSEHLRSYVVDPWWRSARRDDVRDLDYDSRKTLTAMAVALDTLEAASLGQTPASPD
jgi:hypothetical protein